MNPGRTPAPPTGRGSDAKQSDLRNLAPTGAASGPRRNLLLRLRRYGDFSYLSDLELAELCEKYLQARSRQSLRAWAQENR